MADDPPVVDAPLPPPGDNVSLAYRGIREIIPDLTRRYASAKHLDLSYNRISSVRYDLL